MHSRKLVVFSASLLELFSACPSAAAISPCPIILPLRGHLTRRTSTEEGKGA